MSNMISKAKKQALIAFKALKNAVTGNMHMDFMVIKVTDLKSKVRC